MRRLALAAALLATTACNPPPLEDQPVVSGDIPERETVHAMAAKPALGDRVHKITTTTTAPPTTAPVTTAPPAPTPQVPPVPAGSGGNCGGWEGLIASYFPADAVAAACVIARCESEWDAGAVGGPNRNGTYDVGLFQLNDIHGLSRAERLDPATNVAFAGRLYAESGWRPWTCRKALV